MADAVALTGMVIECLIGAIPAVVDHRAALPSGVLVCFALYANNHPSSLAEAHFEIRKA